jgi:hypothetical protein
MAVGELRRSRRLDISRNYSKLLEHFSLKKTISGLMNLSPQEKETKKDAKNEIL